MAEDKPRSSADGIVELGLGPGLPTLRIGSGAGKLVYLPGLSLHPGVPTGAERRMVLSGWEPLLTDYSLYRIGRRVRPIGTSFAEMADDVIAAIEELRPPVDLMGASTGGMIALHVTATRPDLVRRLVLVITGPRASDYGRQMGRRVIVAVQGGHWRSAYATVMQIGARTRPMRWALAALGWLFGPRLMGVPSDTTLLLAELEAWLKTDAESLLARIGCPTLVLGGADDRVFPPELTLAFGRQVPRASVVIVEKLAHDFPARLTADHIAPFLRGTEA